jgi:FlaA1/EpsC-like NDP-sugar epimerase
MDMLSLIGRNSPLFKKDSIQYEGLISQKVAGGSFLVIGGAGSIGQAVVKELFKRNPLKLHVIDISENNLVELVRDLRSSLGYIKGDFRTFALDVGSWQYDAFIKQDGKYDYVLNLSALKHVRSEKDAFTLMRMIEVNILNTIKGIHQSVAKGSIKYFAVSTDKATNPVNMMGASKRIMELFLMRESSKISISTARFANVAFSDGSLLHGFDQRIRKRQPIVAPNDVKRYFVTQEEAGLLCLFSCMLGDNRDIFFPKLSESLHLITFSEIATLYLKELGYEPVLCNTEDEARSKMNEAIVAKTWPCLFSSSDTTGEKDFEEFYTDEEIPDFNRFHEIGIIKNILDFDEEKLNFFLNEIEKVKERGSWSKSEFVTLFRELLPSFSHIELDKYLDDKM